MESGISERIVSPVSMPWVTLAPAAHHAVLRFATAPEQRCPSCDAAMECSASEATMTILHLVHEGNADALAAKMADFSPEALRRRWQAGESDIATSLAHPLWLAPPPRRVGVVVHELRSGVAGSPR